MSIISWAHIYSTSDICLQIKEKHLLARRDDVGLDPRRTLNCSMTHKDGRWPRHAKDVLCAVRSLGGGDTSTRFRPFPLLIDTRIMRVYPSLAFSAVGILLSFLFSPSERTLALSDLWITLPGSVFLLTVFAFLCCHVCNRHSLSTCLVVCDGLSLLSNGSYTHAPPHKCPVTRIIREMSL